MRDGRRHGRIRRAGTVPACCRRDRPCRDRPFPSRFSLLAGQPEEGLRCRSTSKNLHRGFAGRIPRSGPLTSQGCAFGLGCHVFVSVAGGAAIASAVVSAVFLWLRALNPGEPRGDAPVLRVAMAPVAARDGGFTAAIQGVHDTAQILPPRARRSLAPDDRKVPSKGAAGSVLPVACIPLVVYAAV